MKSDSTRNSEKSPTSISGRLSSPTTPTTLVSSAFPTTLLGTRRRSLSSTYEEVAAEAGTNRDGLPDSSSGRTTTATSPVQPSTEHPESIISGFPGLLVPGHDSSVATNGTITGSPFELSDGATAGIFVAAAALVALGVVAHRFPQLSVKLKRHNKPQNTTEGDVVGPKDGVEMNSQERQNTLLKPVVRAAVSISGEDEEARERLRGEIAISIKEFNAWMQRRAEAAGGQTAARVI